MAIIRQRGARALQPAGNSRAEAKSVSGQAVAKRAAKKSAPQKSAARKSAGRTKPAQQGLDVSRQEQSANDGGELDAAFHSLNRAGAVISLLDADSAGDLRALLESGIDLYRHAMGGEGAPAHSALCASSLLRAAEHLAMAGLYDARREYRAEVTAPHLLKLHHSLDSLGARLGEVKLPGDRQVHRLLDMARRLLKRATEMKDDPHLRYELVMAAEAICSALESGLGS